MIKKPREPNDGNEVALEVIVLTREGHSQNQIATALGIGRKRVRNILERYHKRQEQGMDILTEVTCSKKKRSKLDKWADLIEQYLKKFPDITGVRLLEELREAGYTQQRHQRQIQRGADSPNGQPVDHVSSARRQA